MHFSQIKVSDLILVDEEGVVVEGDEPINAAAFVSSSSCFPDHPADFGRQFTARYTRQDLMYMLPAMPIQFGEKRSRFSGGSWT